MESKQPRFTRQFHALASPSGSERRALLNETAASSALCAFVHHRPAVLFFLRRAAGINVTRPLVRDFTTLIVTADQSGESASQIGPSRVQCRFVRAPRPRSQLNRCICSIAKNVSTARTLIECVRSRARLFFEVRADRTRPRIT